ncbi:3'-5' exonuclease [Rhizobium sp. Root1220]|uniref:3'-5' exonuclease n=1 Tax=Rhizobium sp. Root1220 TaxID=1736432 RepID=UPI000701707F|nr:3'-5' exonuclease [Rhizobium sp. Root1220]KQV83367.1 DNA polymerase III subunit epsilon [Rhizobium sp. Root1220]
MTRQFEMFSAEEGAVAPRARREPPAKRLQPGGMTEDGMVEQLINTGRYRILRKLEPRGVASTIRSEFPLRGVILDTETTGLNHRKDEIIEIGAIAFTFDAAGTIGDLIGVYGGLQQPTVYIPAEITKLTGITDAMVDGKTIDMAALKALVDPADLIIAHNAGFDRPFCEAFSPIFLGKAWACSNAEVDWSARGYEGTKLGYLTGQAGYFHDGHRAIDDCYALLEVLARETANVPRTAFAEIYEASQRARVRVFAENSPFDMKDHLKSRGYRWSDGSDGRPKCWWIEVDDASLDDELHYLRTEVYRWPDADPPVKRLTAFDRFKA